MLADPSRVYAGPDGLDDAGPLVTEHDRRLARPLAVTDVEVGVADARGGDPHSDLARPRGLELEVLEPERLAGSVEHGGAHGDEYRAIEHPWHDDATPSMDHCGGRAPLPLYSRPVTSPFPPPVDSPVSAAPRPSSGRRAAGCLFEIVETLVLTIVIFFVIQTFVAQPYQVRQQSMERTLEPGEYVLVDKLSPRWDTYKRGDIVVFEPPEGWSLDGDRTPFIKRVLGEPGDTIELVDGRVSVNGTVIDEPYIFEEADGQAQTTEVTGGQSRWVIPSGEIFVMGDHRGASADSRTFGPVPITSVIGRAWLRYWPIDTFGIIETPTYPELENGTTGAVPTALGRPALLPRAA